VASRNRAVVGIREPDGRVEIVSPTDGFFYQACVHPDGDAVVYAGARTGPPRIWRTDLGGPATTSALTEESSGSRHPAWSWGGDRIAFTSDRSTPGDSQHVEAVAGGGRPEAGNIFSMDPDGGDVRQLTRGAFADQRPTFSPDGRTVVFVSDRDDRIGLWRVDSEHPDEPEPLAYQGFAYRPWFAPDGETLYCFTITDDRHQICRLGIDDPTPTPLANDDDGKTHGPFYDPATDTLIVHSTRGQTRYALYDLPLDGGPPRPIVVDGVDHPMHGTRSRNGLLAFDALFF
jgi:TolB protein